MEGTLSVWNEPLVCENCKGVNFVQLRPNVYQCSACGKIKRESWVTEKSNLTFKSPGIFIYTLIHVGLVFSCILFLYFTMGNGKTAFTKKYLMIVGDPNLNIALFEIISMFCFLTLYDWYSNENIIDSFIDSVSIEEIEIFSEKRRRTYFTPEDDKYIKDKFALNLFKYNQKSVKKYKDIIILLLIVEPVLIIVAIVVADQNLRYPTHSITTSPTAFIVIYFVLYIISDYVVLFEILPSLRDQYKIVFIPKLIYFTILLGIAILIISFSILNFGIYQY